MSYNEQEPGKVGLQSEKEEKLSLRELNTSIAGLFNLYDKTFPDISRERYEYKHEYTEPGNVWRVESTKKGIDIHRETTGLDETNKLYHNELVYIRSGQEPVCIYKKYNFNDYDFNGKGTGQIIETHDDTLTAIRKAEELINAIPQEKKLSQEEIKITATELYSSLIEKIGNSEINKDGKIIVPIQHVFIKNDRPILEVNLEKDKAEIWRFTEYKRIGDILRKDVKAPLLRQESEKVTITKGNSPSVRYEFLSQDYENKSQSKEDIVNTQSAVSKAKKLIEVIPQNRSVPKASLF